MTIKKRWIKAVLETARANETTLPWARGARRQEMITRRKEDDRPRRSA